MERIIIAIAMLGFAIYLNATEGRQWCQWTTCRYGKCQKLKDGFLTPKQMADKFVRPGPGWKITYECWPMRPQQ